MTCDESIERLPWLLNGTLEAGEHDEVRRHLATCEACRVALNDTREAWAIFDQHLPSQALVALSYGEVPEGIDPGLAERHLASCAQCAAELELARMSRRLEEEDNVSPFPVARPRSGASSRSWRNAAAAAGLTALVASAGWIYQIQQTTTYSAQLAQAKNPPAATAPREDSGAIQKKFGELAATVSSLQSRQAETEARAQQAEAQVAELKTRNEAPHASTLVIVDSPVLVRAGEEQNKPEEVPRSNLSVTVLLGTAKDGQEPGGARKVEIVDQTGAKLRLPEGLPPAPVSGYYSLSIPAGFLKPGHYTIRLLDPKSGELRETYALNVK